MNMKKIVATLSVFPVLAVQAAVLYLSPDGSSAAPYGTPETAANDLATVMEAASPGDEIRVAPGVYRPTGAVAGKGVTVRSYVEDGVPAAGDIVFDGTEFAGDGPLLSFSDMSEGPFPEFNGLTFSNFTASVMNFSSVKGVKIENCVFADNGGADVKNGGALGFSLCSGVVITGSVFSANSATNLGGAVCFTSSRNELNAVIDDCTFKSNGIGRPMKGGALYSERIVEVRNCRFSDNTTSTGAAKGSTYGGSVYTGIGSTMENCGFTGYGNAAYGKFVYAELTVVSNCHFTGVTAGANQNFGLITMQAGQLVDCSVTDSEVYTCIVFANSVADTTVGTWGPLRIRNCLFANNTQHESTYFSFLSSYYARSGVEVDNCTIILPPKRQLVKGMDHEVHYTFRNCVLQGKWADTPGSEVVVTENCTDISATLTSLKLLSPVDGLFVPRGDSPLLDAGAALDWHEGAVDFGGRPRVQGKVDIGCFERQPTDVDDTQKLVVATEAEKTGEWADAYVGLQAAIDAVSNSVTRIFVKSGTYELAETIQITNMSVEVVSCGADGKPDRDGTILDGKGIRRILRVVPNALHPSTDVPLTGNRVTFEGFTFTNGVTRADDGQTDAGIGGGVYFIGRAAASGVEPSRFTDCRFTGCKAEYGGGIAMNGGELVDCVLDGNLADLDEGDAVGEGGLVPTVSVGGQGGAVGVLGAKNISGGAFVRDATWFVPGFIGCTFSNNVAEAHGADISNYRRRNVPVESGSPKSSPVISAYIADCRFEGSVITWPHDMRDSADGASVSALHAGTLTNCVFIDCGTTTIGYGVLHPADNTRVVDCTFKGCAGVYGIIYNSSSDVEFDRCRFTDNLAPVRSRGIFRNCLFFRKMGGNAYVYQGEGKGAGFTNCTFTVLDWQNGIYVAESKELTLFFNNCILYKTGSGDMFKQFDNSTAEFSSCCLNVSSALAEKKMTFDGACMIGVDPKFTDLAAEDFTLHRTSPCIDRGVRAEWMTAESTDLARNPRVVGRGRPLAENPGALPDLGCFENLYVPKPFVMTLR